LGRSINVGYSGSSSQPQQISSGGTLLAVYTYTAAGLLASVVYPGGSGYQYGYANGRIVTVTTHPGAPSKHTRTTSTVGLRRPKSQMASRS
jgi:hypothetical protein